MTESTSHRLILLARLKAYLLEMKDRQTVSSGQYQQIDEKLAVMGRKTVAALPDMALEDLLEECRPVLPEGILSFFETALFEDRKRRLLGLRNQALSTGSKLALGDLLDTSGPIVLAAWDWNTVCEAFENIFNNFNHPESDFYATLSLCRNAFGPLEPVCLPAKFPGFSDQIIREIIERQLARPQEIPALAEDVAQIAGALHRDAAQIQQSLLNRKILPRDINVYGEPAFVWLQKCVASFSALPIFDIGPYLVHWTGPDVMDLLDRWLQMEKSGEKRELILAKTGIDPTQDERTWQQRLNADKHASQAALSKFESLVASNRFYYLFAFVISNQTLLGEKIDLHWLPVYQKLQLSLDLFEFEPPEISSLDKTAAEFVKRPTLQKAPERGTDLKDAVELAVEVPDDLSMAEGDELTAARAAPSARDRLVHSHSTWNRYLKPFLTENWLGLIGAGSLMAAWLLISMWLWNKGQLYRLIAGALPMLLTTLALGWTSVFFRNLHLDEQAKAPILFAGLSLLSTPFNFLIALSMLGSAETMGVAAGAGLELANGVVLFQIGRWTRKSLGINTALFLLLINLVLFLPSLLHLFAPIQLERCVNAALFCGLSVTLGAIYYWRNASPAAFRLRCLLLGGNFLLAAGIVLIYYAILPHRGVIALLLSITAAFIAHLNRSSNPNPAVMTFCGLFLLSFLIGLSYLPVLWLCILFSAMTWHRQAYRMKLQWVEEVTALHFYALPAAVIVWLNPSVELLLPAAVFSTLAVAFYEHRQHRLDFAVLTWGIPVIQVGVFLSGFSGCQFGSLVLQVAALLLLGGYGFHRYARLFRRNFWFFNLALMLMTPMAVGGMLNFSPAAHICLFCVATLLWAIAPFYLNDPLTRQHRSTVLWAALAVGTLLFIYQSMVLATLDDTVMVLFTGIVLMAGLSISAFRTHSPVPVYVILVLLEIMGYIFNRAYPIPVRISVGGAVGACLLLYGTLYLKKLSFWERLPEKDRFFHRDFFFISRNFVVTPLMVKAWLLAVTALVKVLLQFELMRAMDGGLSYEGAVGAFVLLLVTGFFVAAALIHHQKHITYLALFPFALLMVSLYSLIRLELMPHCIFMGLGALILLPGRLNLSAAHQPVIIEPLQLFFRRLTELSIPVGLFFYGWLLHFDRGASIPIMIGYGTVMILFNHWFIVSAANLRWSHLNILHLQILWAALLLIHQADTLGPLVMTAQKDAAQLYYLEKLVVIYLLGASLLLILPVYCFETRRSLPVKAYILAAYRWLMVLPVPAVAALIWICNGAAPLAVVYPAAAIAVVHLAYRHRPCLFQHFLKALLAVQLCLGLIQPPPTALFCGIALYFALEIFAFYGLNRFQPRLNAVTSKGIDTTLLMAEMVYAGTLLTIFLHLGLFFQNRSSPPEFYLLYGLIPFSYFSYHKLRWEHLAYLCVGLFAYANGFASLYFKDLSFLSRLDSVHRLSLAATFSILAYSLFSKVIFRRRTAP